MGCRLHWGEEYKIRWTGGWFNWNAEVLRAIFRYLEIEVWDCSNQDDDYGDFEMSFDAFNDLKTIIKDSRKSDTYKDPVMTREELDAVGVDSYNSQYCMTYEDLDKWVKEVDKTYDKSNSYIHFSWF